MNYPVLLIYKNHDEIIYVSSEKEWNESADLSLTPHPKSSFLIDSAGKKYSLNYDRLIKSNDIEHSVSEINLSDYSDLIKGHLFYHAQTCITKLMISSYEEGFAIVMRYQD